ncbi:MAG TPA: portal protein [Candidatus Kapabacteria bacterium]|nr:portal protein [Candidatus Kapabacteria bacterium]
MPSGLNKPEIVEEARKRLRRCMEVEKSIRIEMAENNRFYLGQQWDETTKKEWEDADRPALTFNRIRQFVSLACAAQRQTRPQIKYSMGANNGTDEDTAEILTGLARARQRISIADIAYDTTFRNMCVGGFGAFRFITKFVDDESFDQDLWIEAIPDPTSVYFDCDAVDPLRRDARYVFVRTKISRDAYESKYGTIDTGLLQSFPEWNDWYYLGGKPDYDEFWVCEYWRVETSGATLYRLSDGTSRRTRPAEDEVDANGEPLVVMVDAEGQEITREVEDRKVVQYVINGIEVLEEHEWIGTELPIIGAWAEEVLFDGRRTLLSLIQFQRDPQMAYNYLRSKEVETVAIAPIAPWVGAVGQFKTHGQRWQQSNKEPMAYLEYDPVTVNGQSAGPPQRQNLDVHVEGMLTLQTQIDQDLKATGGLTDPALGIPGKAEQSGKAVKAWQGVTDQMNYHLTDNLTQSMTWAGEVMSELLVKTYNTDRQVKILGEDEAQKIVRVNSIWRDPGGQVRRYFLDKAQYDVAVTVGPSTATRREEAAEGMLEFMSIAPVLFPRVADLIARVQDWPMADEFAERLMPPDIAQQRAMQQSGQQFTPQQAAAMMQQNQQLTGMVRQLQQAIQTKAVEQAGRRDVAQIQAAAAIAKSKLEILKAALQNSNDGEKQRFMAIVNQIEAELDRAHEVRMQQAAAPEPTGGGTVQ